MAVRPSLCLSHVPRSHPRTSIRPYSTANVPGWVTWPGPKSVSSKADYAQFTISTLRPEALTKADPTFTLDLNIGHVDVFIGLFLGAMLPFLFASLTIDAVGRAANKMIEEVRRQFREIPGLREGKPGVIPDSARCVAISTQASLREMLIPGALADDREGVVDDPLGDALLAVDHHLVDQLLNQPVAVTGVRLDRTDRGC